MRTLDVGRWTLDIKTLDYKKMNRPPPYFPQNQLSPPDPNRYKKFKVLVALGAIVLLVAVGGVIYGIYYLISSLLA